MLRLWAWIAAVLVLFFIQYGLLGGTDRALRVAKYERTCAYFNGLWVSHADMARDLLPEDCPLVLDTNPKWVPAIPYDGPMMVIGTSNIPGFKHEYKGSGQFVAANEMDGLEVSFGRALMRCGQKGFFVESGWNDVGPRVAFPKTKRSFAIARCVAHYVPYDFFMKEVSAADWKTHNTP